MPLPKWELAAGSAAMCTLCGSANMVRAFPAMFVQADAPRPEAALEGEAACFDHPNKRAVAACQQCGRFVCQLCSVDFGNGVWCPGCVAGGSRRAPTANQETALTLYDSIALTLPLASLVLWPFNLIAAPASLVLALTKWKQPLSPVRRNRWRFVVAIAISLIEIALWIWLFVYLAARFNMARK